MQPYTKVQLLFPYCMTVPVTPNGDVGSGRMCVGGDTRKEEMRRSWFSSHTIPRTNSIDHSSSPGPVCTVIPATVTV